MCSADSIDADLSVVHWNVPAPSFPLRSDGHAHPTRQTVGMDHPPRRNPSADRPPLQSKRLLDQLRERYGDDPSSWYPVLTGAPWPDDRNDEFWIEAAE